MIVCSCNKCAELEYEFLDDNGNRVPVDVKVGDLVIYSKYGGTEVKYGAEEYLILSQRDVLAIVTH
ncbi:hypothetical protein JTE88_06770 [Arcanobacterium phocisimile]|uniref:10 kDa chaperonin n=1 Tax=Arcanobacterium phocisimile TaxID=1302235 RepID=A0ABX7IF76_9ACTO|nr:hypothetical protein JTE88_06770 [Arcanobacterium phocisimile]